MGTTITPAQLLANERLQWPGMLPREVIIFREWLRLHAGEFDRFDGNVRIGAGHDPGPTWPDEIRRMAIMNTQLRVDAVGYQGAKPFLIEVKDSAGASATGQLVTDEAVWLQDFPSTPAPGLILVTNRVQANILPLIQKMGIRLDVVQVDFSELATKTYYPGFGRGAR